MKYIIAALFSVLFFSFQASAGTVIAEDKEKSFNFTGLDVLVTSHPKETKMRCRVLRDHSGIDDGNYEYFGSTYSCPDNSTLYGKFRVINGKPDRLDIFFINNSTGKRYYEVFWLPGQYILR